MQQKELTSGSRPLRAAISDLHIGSKRAPRFRFSTIAAAREMHNPTWWQKHELRGDGQPTVSEVTCFPFPSFLGRARRSRDGLME